MNFHDLRFCDILNGPGFRTVLFVSGCDHHCPGCHNPETWDPNSGKPFTEEHKQKIISSLLQPEIDGLTITGGDPLFVNNIDAVTDLCAEVKETVPDKSIWVYTGSKYHEVSDLKLMEYIDVLVDQPFIQSLKKSDLLFRGSSNQRLIDVKKTRNNDDIILWCD